MPDFSRQISAANHPAFARVLESTIRCLESDGWVSLDSVDSANRVAGTRFYWLDSIRCLVCGTYNDCLGRTARELALIASARNRGECRLRRMPEHMTAVCIAWSRAMAA